MNSKLFMMVLALPAMLYGQDGIKPIIDVHLHGYTAQSYFIAPAPDGTMAPPTYEQYQAEVKSIMQQYNVTKAVISTIGGENTLDSDGVLIPGYYTDNPPQDTVAFKAAIESGKLQVFGEIGAIYAGNTLADPGFEPYLDICERYDIPVAIHTGGGPIDAPFICCPKYRLTLGDPYLLEEVLVRHPKLRIYMMHAGEAFYENALRLMLQYSHLHAGLGVILWVHEQPRDYAEQFLRKAKKYGLLDRVMFGSDQMVWPHAIEKSIKQLDSYDFLTEEDKRAIFYDNAKRFLKLED